MTSVDALVQSITDSMAQSVGVVVEPIIIQSMRIFAGPFWGLFLMCLGYLLFDWITPFETSVELKNGNLAVGMVICGILVGVGICVGLPLGFALF